MRSLRLDRPVTVNRYAEQRMAERDVSAQLRDKPIVREVSQHWHTHVAYAADGTVMETVILKAAKQGAWPLAIEHRVAA